LFKTITASFSFSYTTMSDFHRVTSYLGEITYDVGDDTREQLALLVFMWALLEAVRECSVYSYAVISITILDRASSNECG
jgi:hypothetical protein